MEIKRTEIIFDMGAEIILRKIFILLLITSLIFSGCALHRKNEVVASSQRLEPTTSNLKTPQATEKTSEPSMITEIKTEEDSKSLQILVKGNRLLNYTEVKQPFPLAILLYFSDTGLKDHAGQDKTYNPEIAENNIIASVKASESGTDKAQKTSKIEISLKKDTSYEIIREDAILKISFEKEEKPVVQENKIEEHDLAGTSEAPKTPEVGSASEAALPQQTATRVHTVYATKLQDSEKVFVGADGMITNYKSFTIESPASIVFDIFNVKSPYENEKVIAVNTGWVKKIRYYGYPDRLRVILETESKYLSSYSAYPVDNGLLINVGRPGSSSAGSGIQGAGALSSPVQTSVGSSLRLEPTTIPRNIAYLPPKGTDAPVRKLQAIYATQFKNGIIVTVRGDGAIKYYESSTIDNPPSIIFDIFNLRSGSSQKLEPTGGKEISKSFPVDTQWVKSIRHEQHPDRLRLFIETRTPYLSAYRANPDENGLLIYIGESSSGITVAGTSPAGSSQRLEPTTASSQRLEPTTTEPVWVNHLNFAGREAGKSELVVKTTNPVRYSIKETEDPLTGAKNGKNLELKIINAQLPKHRQGDLIKEKSFESAVEQIKSETVSGNNSLFSVKLREAVPYYVEQTDNNSIILHFEASSVSPKPEPEKKPSEPVSDIQVTAKKDKEKEDEKEPPEEPHDFSRPIPEIGKLPISLPPAISENLQPLSSPEDENILIEPEKRYTGEKIALDFFETDIKNVFRILKQVSGKNFAIDNDVKGKVTLSLDQPVPWDQVLDLVLKMNQLGRIFEGDIIRVATLATIQKEEKLKQEKLIQMQTMKDQKKALEPIVTEYIPINYSDAEAEIKPHLEKIITKDRGSISVDKRTNIIIMSDTAEKLKRAREIVEKLDRVTPQVLIEAKIVEASTNFSKQIGVDWGAQGGIQSGDSNAGVGPQRGYDTLGGTYGYDLSVNMPDVADYGTLGFNFTRIAGTPFLLNAKLMAMESQGGGKIISTPRILTLDNKAAKISQGYQYPYQTVENDDVETSFKDIDLNLDVTPHITPDNRISMKININKNDLYQETDAGPALTKKSATTELLVNDGDTIVIGGITQSTEAISNYEVPWLSKVPLLGWLFKAKTESLNRLELLIFITPKIVQLEQRRTQY